MRFRRRLKICKGVSLNVSGSGISTSIGLRGASITTGNNGVYANYGIPGTGIYNRQKIAGGNSSRSTLTSNFSSSPQHGSKVVVRFSMDLDDNNNPIVMDQNGVPITDDILLSAIKRTPEYKQGVHVLSQRVINRIAEKDSGFIEIYKHTERPISEKEVLAALNELQPEVYDKNTYSKEEPTLEGIKSQLEEESKNKISSILFWTIKKKREQYVSSNLQHRFDEIHSNWAKEKKEFEDYEDRLKKEYDELNLKEYEKKKSRIENILAGEESYVEQKIQTIISQIELPIEFSIDYEYHPDDATLLVDLDLPEIEDMPNEIAKTLKSGKVSVRTKSQKQTTQEYATCVCGLAFFFSGMFFNVSTKINWIRISGYTQRLNPKTNTINDDYVFSVKFNRDDFSRLDYKNINPVESLMHFPHLIDLTTTYRMKTINPQHELKTIDCNN